MDLYVVPSGLRGIADGLDRQVDQVAAARPTFSWADLGPSFVASAFSSANRAGHDARGATADRIEALAHACDHAASTFEDADRSLSRSASEGAGGGGRRVQ